MKKLFLSIILSIITITTINANPRRLTEKSKLYEAPVYRVAGGNEVVAVSSDEISEMLNDILDDYTATNTYALNMANYPADMNMDIRIVCTIHKGLYAFDLSELTNDGGFTVNTFTYYYLEGDVVKGRTYILEDKNGREGN